MPNDSSKTEPSAYALYRRLKAEGYTPCVSNELLVAIGEPVPDDPQPRESADSSDNLAN